MNRSFFILIYDKSILQCFFTKKNLGNSDLFCSKTISTTASAQIERHSWLECQGTLLGQTVVIFGQKLSKPTLILDIFFPKMTIVHIHKLLNFNKTPTFYLCRYGKSDPLKPVSIFYPSIHSEDHFFWDSVQICFLDLGWYLLSNSWCTEWWAFNKIPLSAK